MKIPPVKGTRDFYPEDMAVRNWLTENWKQASIRNGFEEYDGPIFEYLKMYQIKSGEEIIEQLFNLVDRGGRELAIRPEITPTLARMVNQRVNALPRPIKWFSIPRLCRAERPQKGRLREFFQWNIDIVGLDDVLADAEIIFTAVDFLVQIGLTSADIVVRISSRKMLAQLLIAAGIPAQELEPLYGVLDKRAKVSPEDFEKMLSEVNPDSATRKRITDIMSVTSLDELKNVVELTEGAIAAIDEVRRLFDLLKMMGIEQFCRFDIGIVRGLAYYTGIVFEAYDRNAELRAIGGGGRYDNLLKQFGGPEMTATGFGMGDCVLAILLEEKGLLKDRLPIRKVDYFVAFADDLYRDKAIHIAAALRRKGKSALFSYKSTKLGKQLKEASDLNSVNCVIVGHEIDSGQIIVKDLATGEQAVIKLETLLEQ